MEKQKAPNTQHDIEEKNKAGELNYQILPQSSSSSSVALIQTQESRPVAENRASRNTFSHVWPPEKQLPALGTL